MSILTSILIGIATGVPVGIATGVYSGLVVLRYSNFLEKRVDFLDRFQSIRIPQETVEEYQEAMKKCLSTVSHGAEKFLEHGHIQAYHNLKDIEKAINPYINQEPPHGKLEFVLHNMIWLGWISTIKQLPADYYTILFHHPSIEKITEARLRHRIDDQ